MSPACENDSYHTGKNIVGVKAVVASSCTDRSLESEVISHKSHERSLSFTNCQMSLDDRYRYDDDSQQQQNDRYSVKNETAIDPNNCKNFSSQEYSNCALGSSVEMKDWSCNEFGVEDSMKIAHETSNADVTVPNESTASKIDTPRDKALFNLLQQDEQCIQNDAVAHTSDPLDHCHDKHKCEDRASGAKEYSQGVYHRYELTSAFDIDDWHCKDAMVENSDRRGIAAPRDVPQNDSDVARKVEACDRTGSLEPITDRTAVVTSFVGVPNEWFDVAFQGLNGEAENELRKKYPLSGVFDRFGAQRAEAKRFANKIAQEADEFHATALNHTGSGISAIFTALAALRSGDNAGNFDRIAESLVDAGKIFAHLHYLHSERKKSSNNSNIAGSNANNTVVGNSPRVNAFRDGTNASRAHNAPKTHQIIPNGQSRSYNRRETSTTADNSGNNFNAKNPTGMNCTNETISQRVKRSLCGITDEEYNAKKKREESGQDTFPGIVEILKQARAMHGVHEELLLSWPCNAGAVKRYQKPIKLWWEYCQRESIDVYDVSVSTLKSFFVDITKEPKTYETLNAYKTAVLLLTPEKLEKDRSFTEFLKKISIDARKT